MSTHRHSLRGYRNTCVPLFLVRCGLLLALQLWVASSSVAFASAAHSMTVSVTPTPIPTQTVPAGFAHAKVSVVRLLVSYIDPTDSNRTIPPCTGLGVLVRSFPVSSVSKGTTSPNDWVLTDGSLVDTAQATCAGLSAPTGGTLSQIQIRFNTTSPSKSKVVTLDSTSNSPVSNSVTCSDAANCSNGPALLAFHGDQMASIDVAASSTGKSLSAIALTDVSGKLPNPGDVIAGDTEFLTPQPFDGNTSNLELGTPLIDATGNLAGLHTPKPVKFETISSLVQSIPISQQRGNTPTPTATPLPAGTFVVPGTSVALEWWQWMTLALLLLILVILLTALVIRSRRAQTSRLSKAEWDEAERRSVIEAQQIETMAAARRAWEEHQLAAEQPIVPIQQQGLQEKMGMRKTAPDLHCPRCGEFIAKDANYCPNCRLRLTHSESGPHLRIPLPTSLAQPSTTLTPQVEFDATDIRADINIWQLMEQKGE